MELDTWVGRIMDEVLRLYAVPGHERYRAGRRKPHSHDCLDANLGWKGALSYVALAPQIFDLWTDPQERYDLFMNNFTEKTWFLPTIQDVIGEFMKSYVDYPPHKIQSNLHPGPIIIQDYLQFQDIKQRLKEG